MRVAVSNIAWTADEDDEVAALLAALGVDAVEVAPTRLFPDVEGVSPRAAVAVRARLAEKGLEIVAFQSLLFGLAEADVFGDPDVRGRTADRLRAVIRLAGLMGSGPLVFGSPSARRPREGMSFDQALDAAAAFFVPLAARAFDEGAVLCVEPNPPQYGCTFITTADEGAALVAAVDSPGFGLHLDAAAMALVGDDGPAAVRRHAGVLRHFHASAPGLGELELDVVQHAALGYALNEIAYRGVLSIEMRAAESGTNADRVRRAVRLVEPHYLVSEASAP